jgi:hypothetical protein
MSCKQCKGENNYTHIVVIEILKQASNILVNRSVVHRRLRTKKEARVPSFIHASIINATTIASQQVDEPLSRGRSTFVSFFEPQKLNASAEPAANAAAPTPKADDQPDPEPDDCSRPAVAVTKLRADNTRGRDRTEREARAKRAAMF